MTQAQTARCRCGALSATCTGEPVRISACHCLECKARSGSAFAAQVRFPKEQVTLSGQPSEWVYTGDSGSPTSFYSCPTCSTTLWFINSAYSDTVAVALGNFEDPWAFTPRVSVYESRKLDWVEIVGDGIERV
jgi:hypothetical protein